MAQFNIVSSLKPITSTVIDLLPSALGNAVREDERKALAVTAVACVGASALTIKLMRTLSPSFDAKCFFWSSLAQSYVTFGFSSVTRPIFRRVIGGDFLAPCAADKEVDVQWLIKVLEETSDFVIRDVDRRGLVATIDLQIVSGGFISDIRRITLEWPEGADDRLPRSLILKSLPHSRHRYFSSIIHGTPREAFFYAEHAKRTTELSTLLPKVYYSHGSWVTGEYVVLMEDLSKIGAVSASVMLGNQCWGAKPIPKELEQDPVVVLEAIFLETADFHAKFWRDFSLLNYSWFKTSGWLKGGDRARWELAMRGMRRKWERVKTALKNKTTTVVWSDKMINAMEKALTHTSWENFRREFDVNDPKTPFTLCHGDYHAGNILWAGKEKRPQAPAIFVDWSDVGVFCPFTEIAQFMISNATIEIRRKHERALFESYHRRLIERGVSAQDFPLERCWDRYCAGGVEKWLQFMILLSAMNLAAPNHLPDFGIQWFHNQVLAFVEDHGDRVPSSPISPGFMTGFCALLSRP